MKSIKKQNKKFALKADFKHFNKDGFIKKITSAGLVIVLSAISLSTSACSVKDLSKNNNNDNYIAYETEENEAFNEYTDNLFREIATDDTASLHTLLEHPENYSIDNYDITLGRIDTESLDDTSDITQYITDIKAFNRETLSKSQQVTYDLLLKYLETQLCYSDLSLYDTALTPTIGIQIQLPLIFSEYSFLEKKDIEEYIQLISDTDGYFENLLEYENLRASKGYTLEDSLLDEVIDSCRSIIDSISTQNGLFIEDFNSKIDAVDFINEEEKNTYKTQNLDAVKSHVIPAYQSLIDGISALKGTCKYGGGICNYPDGARYFEGLLEQTIGWSKSVEDYTDLLDTYTRSYALVMNKLMTRDTSLADKFSTFSFAQTEPDSILNELKTKITDDYPELEDVDYSINYVSEALEDYASPAMYFMPQIDNLNINSIYINSSQTSSDLYPTLAHEGYPGHLYQTQYFASTNPSLIRYAIKPGGYVEGWASYTEVHSYAYGTGSAALNSLAQCNYALILCLYAQGDIGVNYYGWSEANLASFLTNWGFDSASAAHEMYQAFIANPGNYCKYVLGFIGFEELKKQAQSDLNDNFSLKEFHRYVLETGPVQMDILFNNLKEWENSLIVSSRAA